MPKFEKRCIFCCFRLQFFAFFALVINCLNAIQKKYAPLLLNFNGIAATITFYTGNILNLLINRMWNSKTYSGQVFFVLFDTQQSYDPYTPPPTALFPKCQLLCIFQKCVAVLIGRQTIVKIPSMGIRYKSVCVLRGGRFLRYWNVAIY